MLTQERIKALFILRDDSLHWRDTGVLAGYLTTACRAGRKVNPYPWIVIPNSHYQDTSLVHRLMLLHEDGELPPGIEVNHINGIQTDNNRWNLEGLTKAEHVARDKQRRKREKELGVYFKPKHKPDDLDPSDEKVRGVAVKVAEQKQWAWLAMRVHELFIMRDSRLHWRNTGVEAGYLSVPMGYREKQRAYPYVSFDGEYIKVHRLTWLYLHGSLPNFRKRPSFVIHHINENKFDCNQWNLQKITQSENTRRSSAQKEHIERQRVNGNGFYDSNLRKKGVEIQRRKGTGFFNPEIRKMGPESQRINGTGFYDPRLRKKNHETQRRNGTGFFNPEVMKKAHKKSVETQQRNEVGWFNPTLRMKGSKRGIETQRRNGIGLFNMEVRKKGVEKACESHIRNGTGFFDSEVQKKANVNSLETNRRNGTGFFNPETHKKAVETNRHNGTALFDPEIQKRGSEAANHPEARKKSADACKVTMRRKRWKKFRRDFAVARATGDLQEVLKVAKRENMYCRIRAWKQRKRAKQAAVKRGV